MRFVENLATLVCTIPHRVGNTGLGNLEKWGRGLKAESLSAGTGAAVAEKSTVECLASLEEEAIALQAELSVGHILLLLQVYHRLAIALG